MPGRGVRLRRLRAGRRVVLQSRGARRRASAALARRCQRAVHSDHAQLRQRLARRSAAGGRAGVADLCADTALHAAGQRRGCLRRRPHGPGRPPRLRSGTERSARRLVARARRAAVSGAHVSAVVSAAKTHGVGTASGSAGYEALDLRLGAMFRTTLFETLSPYAVARVFGGPVFWRYRGSAVTGTDVSTFSSGSASRG